MTNDLSPKPAPPAEPSGSSADFQRYYTEAGPDYAAWSPNFNMHFGYFRRGLNPFRREPMLEQMNREILKRLNLDRESASSTPDRVLDMGCGVSATLRSFARALPAAELTGITIVPWQIEQGIEINQASPATSRIQLMLADYENTPFPAASFNAAYALESSCYASHANKSALLAEAHRLLVPGGRLAVADGFLLRPPRNRGLQHAIVRRLCNCWVIDTLGEIVPFTEELARLGFRDIRVEHLQYRVAPSVMHVPWVTLKFLISNVVFGSRKMNRARWNNILAPILLPFVSHPIGPMSYCLITATKD